MDVSGLEVMEEQAKRLHRAGKQIVLCGLCRQPLRMLSRAGFLDEVGRSNVCRNLQQALARVAELAEGAPPSAGPAGSGAGGSGAARVVPSGPAAAAGHA